MNQWYFIEFIASSVDLILALGSWDGWAAVPLAVSWISSVTEEGWKETCHLIFVPATANKNFLSNPPEATDGSWSNKWPIRSFATFRSHRHPSKLDTQWGVLNGWFTFTDWNCKQAIFMQRWIHNGALANLFPASLNLWPISSFEESRSARGNIGRQANLHCEG